MLVALGKNSKAKDWRLVERGARLTSEAEYRHQFRWATRPNNCKPVLPFRLMAPDIDCLV